MRQFKILDYKVIKNGADRKIVELNFTKRGYYQHNADIVLEFKKTASNNLEFDAYYENFAPNYEVDCVELENFGILENSTFKDVNKSKLDQAINDVDSDFSAHMNMIFWDNFKSYLSQYPAAQ